MVGLGANNHGQLGTGDYTARTTSAALSRGPRGRPGARGGDGVGAELIGVTRIAAGVNHALASPAEFVCAWGAENRTARRHRAKRRAAHASMQRLVPLAGMAASSPLWASRSRLTPTVGFTRPVPIALGDGPRRPPFFVSGPALRIGGQEPSRDFGAGRSFVRRGRRLGARAP